MNVHGGEDQRRQFSIGESTLTVKWWGVVGVFIVVCAFYFGMLMQHETRITRTEEATKIILDLKGALRCIEAELKAVNSRLAGMEAKWEASPYNNRGGGR